MTDALNSPHGTTYRLDVPNDGGRGGFGYHLQLTDAGVELTVTHAQFVAYAPVSDAQVEKLAQFFAKVRDARAARRHD